MAGVAIGRAASPSDPAPPPVSVTKTREVEKEVKIQVPYIPGDCKDAVRLAGELEDVVGKYEEALGESTMIQSEAHTAIVTKDLKKLQDVERRQRDMKRKTIGLLVDIRDKGDQLDRTMKNCERSTR